jgi:hypothetical protein
MLITSRGLMTLALSPFIILLASGTRLILISNYDTTTATTMAASGGLGETLLGTVIPLLPPFLPALLVIFAIFRQWWCLAFAAVATALVSPAYIGVHEGLRAAYSQFQDAISHAWHWQWHHLWQDSRLLIWCAALGAVFALWDNVLCGKAKTAPISAIWVAVICALALLFIQQIYHVKTDPGTISETLRRPWLPMEKIDLKSGESHTGYVLSTDKEWFTVLDDNKRTIDYIRSSDILNRTVGPPPCNSLHPLIPLKSGSTTPVKPCTSPH